MTWTEVAKKNDSLPEGDAVDHQAVLLEVYPDPEQVGAEGPGEHPLLGHLLGLVDELSVEDGLLLATHQRVNQRHLHTKKSNTTFSARRIPCTLYIMCFITTDNSNVYAARMYVSVGANRDRENTESTIHVRCSLLLHPGAGPF